MSFKENYYLEKIQFIIVKLKKYRKYILIRLKTVSNDFEKASSYTHAHVYC